MKKIYLIIVALYCVAVIRAADSNESDDAVITAQKYIGKLNVGKQKEYGPVVDGQLLFPTIIQNIDGTVLGLAYSSQESLTQAIEQKKGIYYSRSRKEIWYKSPSGKNGQDLIDIQLSCDGTALLFTVRQKGVFCHEGCKSCFEAALNKDLTVLNQPPVIKIGICKGRQSDTSFNLLSSMGIHVYKNQRPRSTDFLVTSDLYSNFQLLEIRSSDIATLINQGVLDIVLCYDNLLTHDQESRLIKIGKQQGIHPVKVVAIKRVGESVAQNPVIFSEYPDLTQEWALQHFPAAKIVEVHGGAESLLAQNMCDLAVAVTDSGSTIKANKLEVYDTLCDTDLHVYVTPRTQEKHPNIVRAIRNSLQDDSIYFFSVGDKYGFLSNFYPAEFQTDDGQLHEAWKSSEHYYQAHKFKPEGTVYAEIRNAKTAQEAYKIAHSHADEARPDWENVKEAVMKKALFYKFSQNQNLRQKLLATDDRTLIEHAMKDSYWGIGADGNGKNRLGKLLMELRAELATSYII